MAAPLASVGELATLLRLTISGDDPYSKLMLGMASNEVRRVAKQPTWVPQGTIVAVDSTDTWVSDTGHDVTLMLASRLYTDKVNLQRRTAGPISETFFENGVHGLELTDDEVDKLKGDWPTGRSNGLWVQRIGAGKITGGSIRIPEERPLADGIYFSAQDEGAFGPVL